MAGREMTRRTKTSGASATDKLRATRLPRRDARTTEAAGRAANEKATKSASTPSDLLTTPVRPEPGPRETAAIADAKMRVRARKNRLAVAALHNGETLILGPRHSDVDGYSARMMDAFGTNSNAFY